MYILHRFKFKESTKFCTCSRRFSKQPAKKSANSLIRVAGYLFIKKININAGKKIQNNLQLRGRGKTATCGLREIDPINTRQFEPLQNVDKYILQMGSSFTKYVQSLIC
jgi:hypothetical protein